MELRNAAASVAGMRDSVRARAALWKGMEAADSFVLFVSWRGGRCGTNFR